MDKRGFKAKTIVKTINEKVSLWLKSIKDEDLREEIEKDYILTGGAITSMLMGDLPNDYDIYFKTPEIAKRVVEYYMKGLVQSQYVNRIEAQIINNDQVKIMIKSIGVVGDESEIGVVGDESEIGDYKYFENEPVGSLDQYMVKWATAKVKDFKPALFTSNAISLYGNVQLITRFVGSPEDIHKNYDFVHCTNWYTKEGGLVLNQAALESILAQELKYVGSRYPVCSMFRLKKFIKRGWTITAGEMLKIAWDISKLDLSNPKVLEEQLVGVDYAYFREVLNILQKEFKDGSEKSLDRTYLFETINRVFDEMDDVEQEVIQYQEESNSPTERQFVYQDTLE